MPPSCSIDALTTRTELRPFRLRVLAVGSPHGDDRAGWEAGERLALHPELAGAVVRVGSPIELVSQLENCDRAIILDACRLGAAPGTVRRLSLEEALIDSSVQRSTHGVSVGDALRMSLALHGTLPEIMLLAVEIRDAQPGCELSASALRGVETVVAIVLRELKQVGLELTSEASRRDHAAAPEGAESDE